MKGTSSRATPAKAGVQLRAGELVGASVAKSSSPDWTPAFAGVGSKGGQA